MSDLFGRCYPRRLCLGQRECCLMFAVHCELQWPIKQRLCQFGRRRTVVVFSILGNPRWKRDRLDFTQSKQGHVDDLCKRRARTTSRTPCGIPSRHSTPMVQQCTGNWHSIAFRSSSRYAQFIVVRRPKRRRVTMRNSRSETSRHASASSKRRSSWDTRRGGAA